MTDWQAEADRLLDLIPRVSGGDTDGRVLWAAYRMRALVAHCPPFYRSPDLNQPVHVRAWEQVQAEWDAMGWKERPSWGMLWLQVGDWERADFSVWDLSI